MITKPLLLNGIIWIFVVNLKTKHNRRHTERKDRNEWHLFSFTILALNYADYSAEHANRSDNVNWAGMYVLSVFCMQTFASFFCFILIIIINQSSSITTLVMQFVIFKKSCEYKMLSHFQDSLWRMVIRNGDTETVKIFVLRTR